MCSKVAASSHAAAPVKLEPLLSEFCRRREYVATRMSISIEDLRKLPVPERLELVEFLWDSIAADADQLLLTDQQAEELDRRLADHKNNPDEGSSWPDLRDRLQKSR